MNPQQKATVWTQSINSPSSTIPKVEAPFLDRSTRVPNAVPFRYERSEHTGTEDVNALRI